MSRIKKVELWIFGLSISATSLAAEWSAQFQPYERDATPDLVPVFDSMQFWVYAACGLGAIVLYTIAGVQARKGEPLHGFLTLIGATIVAVSPIIAQDALK